MHFNDPLLQKCYDRNLAEAGDSSDGRDQIRALIAAHDLFFLLEGAHSARVHEAMDSLLLPEVRSDLRRWYQRDAAEADAATIELRDQLSQLAGERLEQTNKPS